MIIFSVEILLRVLFFIHILSTMILPLAMPIEAVDSKSTSNGKLQELKKLKVLLPPGCLPHYGLGLQELAWVGP